MTISRMSTEARCTVDRLRPPCLLSPGRRVQHVARESSFDIRDLTVDLAEPVRCAGRDDDDVARTDVAGLTARDSRRPVLRIRHCPAGRVRAAALENVVDLRHVLTVALPGVNAGVVGA